MQFNLRNGDVFTNYVPVCVSAGCSRVDGCASDKDKVVNDFGRLLR